MQKGLLKLEEIIQRNYGTCKHKSKMYIKHRWRSLIDHHVKEFIITNELSPGLHPTSEMKSKNPKPISQTA